MLTDPERAEVVALVLRDKPGMEASAVDAMIADMERAIDALVKYLVPVVETVGLLLTGDMLGLTQKVYRRESAALVALAASVCDSAALPALANELHEMVTAWGFASANEFDEWADAFAARARALVASPDGAPTLEALICGWLSQLARNTIADERPEIPSDADPAVSA